MIRVKEGADLLQDVMAFGMLWTLGWLPFAYRLSIGSVVGQPIDHQISISSRDVGDSVGEWTSISSQGFMQLHVEIDGAERCPVSKLVKVVCDGDDEKDRKSRWTSRRVGGNRGGGLIEKEGEFGSHKRSEHGQLDVKCKRQSDWSSTAAIRSK
jgi:hypothetical protein